MNTQLTLVIMLLLLLSLSLFLEGFSHQRLQMLFHWSLIDSKSSQVSRTFLSILADLSNAVVWMVSTRPFISKSSTPCINPLMTVPKAPNAIGINVTFMFYSFFGSIARSWYLSFFSLSFNFTQSVGTAKSTILEVLFLFFFFLIIIRSGRLAEMS